MTATISTADTDTNQSNQAQHDENLEIQCTTALRSNCHVTTAVQVQVNGNSVDLTGQAETYFEKQMAQESLARLPVSINNEITVPEWEPRPGYF